MASTPQFASTAQTWLASGWLILAGGTTQSSTISDAAIGGANSRSGKSATLPTGAVLLVTAGASGSRVDEVTFTALTTSSANVGRIFIADASSTRVFLYKEVSIPAVTAAAGTPVASVTTSFNNLILAAGYKLYVSVATMGTTTDGGYSVTAFGGDF
jgi:hypothetical protein